MGHMVFVYGTLKMGHQNHGLLLGPGVRFVDFASTHAEFRMISFGNFPAVIRGGETSIHGEIYEVDDSTLERLDRLEGHPHFYERQETLVGDHLVQMYILPESYLKRRRIPSDWNKEIKTGVWA